MFKVLCLSEAQSPITHMMGSSGNESVLNREPIVVDSTIIYVPVLSGNALRHKALRETGAKYLIDVCDLKGKLSIEQVNFLLHGGNLTQGSQTDDWPGISAMHALSPWLKLLGGSWNNAILPGSVICLRGLLVCDENRQAINNLVPEEYRINEPLLSAEAFVAKYQYTRADEQTADEEDLTRMIYAGQSVIRGSMWLHGFVCHDDDLLSIGCLLHCLQLWQEHGGIIGGMSGRGHGRLKTQMIGLEGTDINAAVGAYTQHVHEYREAFSSWLHQVFTPKQPKKRSRAVEEQPSLTA